MLARPKRRLDLLAPDGRLELSVVLTHACNLSCSYCYTGEKKRVRMTLDTARRALDLGFDAVRRGARELQITFFGGEPLLEHGSLLAIADEARARARDEGVRLYLQTTTNGTLLDDQLLVRLEERSVHLALSIDGTRRAHEANRPLAGGGSSYDATLKALSRLVARRRPFDVIAVVDPGNVAELAKSVRDLCDRGVDALTLNMNWGGAWDDERLALFERRLEEVAAIFIAWLRRGRFVRIEPLAGAIEAIERGARPAARCDAGARRIAVAPSGRLYPCARSVGEDTGSGAIGHLDHGLSLAAHRAEGTSCHCAALEEIGRRTGKVKPRHDAIVEALARRVVAVLCADAANDTLGKDTGHAISY